MTDRRANQPWFDCAPCEAPRVRLFCLPYAGAGSSIFRSWPGEVLNGIQVCGIQLPGREDRLGEPAFTRLDPLIEAIADRIGPLLDLPVAFFGHCMGALVAFELARRLRRAGCEPIHLVVSALPAPRLVAQAPVLHTRSTREFVSALTGLNGIPDALLKNPEFLNLMVPTMRADFELCETYWYRAEPPLGCRISAYGGRQDPRCPSNLLGSWGAETSAKFTARYFPGDHFFIESARAAVLSAISIDLLGTLIAERSGSGAPRQHGFA